MVVGDAGVLDMSAVGGDPDRPVPSTVLVWEDPATDRMRLVRRAVRYAGALNRPRLGEHEFDPVHHETARRRSMAVDSPTTVERTSG